MALIYMFGANDIVTYDEISDDIVLLSPSLYWFKLCTIPTKNRVKAKNIAEHMMSERPSAFSEVLLYPNAEEYNAYAYDKSALKEQLKKFQFKDPKVYFSNQLHLSETISINEEICLYTFNNRVMESRSSNKRATKSLVQNYKELLQGEKPLTSFEKSGKDMTLLLSIFTTLFFLYTLMFGFEKEEKLHKIDSEIAELKTDGKSFYEIESLIKKYGKLEKSSQKMKRELDTILKKSGIENITYANHTYKVKR